MNEAFILFYLETPETAFIYALTSASIMHNIGKACARGELTECGCEKSPSSTMPVRKMPSTPNHDGFEWGGCSEDLKFGRSVSTTFLDTEEKFSKRRRIVRMINLHNNEAGRLVSNLDDQY